MKSLKKINYALFISIFILNFIPTIYTTLRVYLIGNLPDAYAFSIAGELSWVSLIYEIFQEGIILPLFYFIGKAIDNKEQLNNKIRTGLLVTILIYLVISIIVIIFVKPMLHLMATNKDIIDSSATYIRLESIANIFGVVYTFILVVFEVLKKTKYLYIILLTKLILSIVFDLFLVSNLSFSLKLGINGIAVSNIISSIVLIFVSILLLYKENIKIFEKTKLDFSWFKELVKKAGLSALESFVRNLFYMVMILRMVNSVNEQGVYWVANNFIWGWLLLPVISLGEVIKSDCGRNKEAIKENSIGYLLFTLIIIIIWFLLIPTYKFFMKNVLQYSDVDKLFKLVMILIGFYAVYALQNVFDSIFYGIGKINYMIFETIIDNFIYYGTAFILYKLNIWVPSLENIALLFGFGMLFDGVVSTIAYLYLLKKEKIKLEVN